MGSMDGILHLVSVTQLKASNSNDDALHGAEKQRELVKAQQGLRARVSKFEEFVRDKNLTDGEYWAIARMMIDEGLSTTNAVDGSYNGILGHYDEGHHGEVGHWNAKIGGEPDNELTKANEQKIESIRKAFDSKGKDLEAEDRLGNFEIQRLMSTFNQMETLSSNVQKKADDTASGQQQKIA
jgi:hypothetical protein